MLVDPNSREVFAFEPQVVPANQAACGRAHPASPARAGTLPSPLWTRPRQGRYRRRRSSSSPRSCRSRWTPDEAQLSARIGPKPDGGTCVTRLWAAQATVTSACHRRCQETGTPGKMHGGEGERQARDRRRGGAAAKTECGDGQPGAVGGRRSMPAGACRGARGTRRARRRGPLPVPAALSTARWNESGCRFRDREEIGRRTGSTAGRGCAGYRRTHQSKTTDGSSRSRPPARRYRWSSS